MEKVVQKISIVLLMFCTPFCVSQTKEFKPSVTITHLQKSEIYKTPKSILFVFNDSGHLANYYSQLFKDLKKTFKKEKIKIGSEFNFTNKKDFAIDISNAPKNRDKRNNFDVICAVSSEHQKTPLEWSEYESIEKRKTHHFLKLSFFNGDRKQLLDIKLEIYAYYTIATQTKETSKLLNKLLH